MECNKEEAIRAKSIAENKMLNKDFIGARKIVLKAQQLYPDLENVAQMLTVCEVHCSAEVKVNGEMDWYGILQVVPTADELTIKKQYRKLALLLHPDKNKFGGAEGAFKLVGEAHRTLTDRSKRVLHDMKRGASLRAVSARQPAPHSNKTSFTKKQPGVACSVPNSTSQFNGFNQQQAAPFSGNQTFWTLCPSCGIRYQYYQNIMNRVLRCQSCKKPFIAYDLNAHAVPSAAPWNRTGIPQKEKPVPAAHFAGQKSNFGTGSGMGSQGNVGGSSAASQPWSNTEFEGASNNDSKEGVHVDLDGGTANDVKFEKVKLQEVNKREQTVKTSAGNRSQKRGRKIVLEHSESESSDSDVVVEDGYPSRQNTGTTGSHPRRSTRQKQNISYNEDGSDDEFVHLKHKKSRTGSTSEQNDVNGVNVQTSEPAVSTGRKDRKGEGGASYASSVNGLHKREQGRSGKEHGLNASSSSKASASIDFSSEASPDDPEGYTYPDPEFYDFEGLRDENKFSVDQIWALYDQLDAMPRYYALIRHVYGPKFKVRFNWLEYDPTGKGETLWFNGGLPIGCGSFKLGKSEHTQERLMFSHPMPWRKGAKKNSYDIFPRKSEVWALFKNWDIEWSSCVDSGRQYEYEIVEVMSDFTEGDVISVVRLVKVQGFVSLFVQAIDKESSSIKIQMKDVLQFSHKIPSYRLTGNEREGIPKGSLELDCASLPLNFAEMFPSISLESFKVKAEDLNNVYDGLHSKSAGSEGEVPTCAANESSSELNRVAVEELRRSQDTFANKGNDTCEDEPKSSGMTKQAAVGSQQHRESDKTCKERIGAKENINSRDPNTFSAFKNHTDSEQQSGSPHSSHWYEYPDSEFHNFEEERSRDKFEEGQIWALYSDMDKNPNYYGRITKVESEKKFRVHVTWLEGCSEQERERFWFEEQLPVGCGTFQVIQDSCVLDLSLIHI